MLVLEPVAVASLPEAVDSELAEPVAVAPSMGKKWELKQACWQSVYFLVSEGVPVPWGHLATQLLVSSAWLSLGQGTL